MHLAGVMTISAKNENKKAHLDHNLKFNEGKQVSRENCGVEDLEDLEHDKKRVCSEDNSRETQGDVSSVSELKIEIPR